MLTSFCEFGTSAALHLSRLVHHGRLSLLGYEFIIVAFRSAKVASVNATFAEQKATMFCITRIKSQPIREIGVTFTERKATMIANPNIWLKRCDSWTYV